jgi:thymidine phosphorylase
MDVKVGSGAFMPTMQKSRELSHSILNVCHAMKTRVIVLITDMEQPLGRAIGNALEIRECIEFLNGNTSEDLETVSLALAAHMIRLGGQARTLPQASRRAYEAVSKGAAAERFRRIIREQEGDERVVDHPDLLPKAKHVETLSAKSAGFITRCDAKLLGLASNALGAGRNTMDDTIDPAVGLLLKKKLGDRVTRGETLCEVHWNHAERARAARPLIENAFEIKPRRSKPRPLIHAVLEG